VEPEVALRPVVSHAHVFERVGDDSDNNRGHIIAGSTTGTASVMDESRWRDD